MQRLRITFAREGGAAYLSHLDTMRMWERVFRRAGWRLAYSHGFNPHPKLSFAAALPVGVESHCELLDVQLEEARSVDGALVELGRQMPEGFEVLAVAELPVDAPPLQRFVFAAEYEARCPPGASVEELACDVDRLLRAASLPRTRAREGKTTQYDLRPMVQELSAEGEDERPKVWMRLRTDAQGAGRADEVLRELGLDPAECAIVRTRLLLSEDTP